MDLNSPELCWTKMMSMAPLRVALLMLAMLDTTPLKKFMAGCLLSSSPEQGNKEPYLSLSSLSVLSCHSSIMFTESRMARSENVNI